MMLTETRVRWKRIGPVFLYWSEYDDEAVVGPSEGAWGGDDLYHCDDDNWVGDYDEAIDHARGHGYDVTPR